MLRAERKLIENIILINPLIYGLADKIEREQERIISDMSLPADRVIKKLFELDDRRVDLCNLKVLYGFLEDELGDGVELLRTGVRGGAALELYERAARGLARAGYSLKRAEREFSYLLKQIKRPRGCRRRLPPSEVCSSAIAAAAR